MEIDCHDECMCAVARKCREDKKVKNVGQQEELLKKLEEGRRRQHGSQQPHQRRINLSETEFRDALALRYRHPLQLIPLNCDGCGATFSLEHALSCKQGGMVLRRHNEVRDALGGLISLGKQVVREPILWQAGEDGTGQLKGDLLA
eukprot:GHVN01003798.1.p1 GENE.GHVN01003798.1~~GHVN01003798.1.p1  ORF type:complete len:146 (-),score=23.27 GHVN01003798.1:129-566(-)